jgi:hypothetical protein
MTVNSSEVGGSTTSSILCDWRVFSKNNWREQYVSLRERDDQFALQKSQTSLQNDNPKKDHPA